MKIYQSNLFARKVKRFHHNQKLVLDKIILKIAKDSKIGSEKKGDLKGIFVYKFKINQQQYLLSYRKKGKNLELITIGSHENYYRDLKTYLKSSS
ncbi:MAG TPA: type II toxin-antitoxin system RelE/ParE family toxin [Ignavibacteria bacterium]|nr:type II toxin-antitoxin system RelE/ParE family toxin [Ignavibacteria bacterium]